MAEVIAVEKNVQAVKKRSTRGNYSPMEDLILVREVAALRARVAAYGSVRQTFEQVAGKVNLNPQMIQKVTRKAVQDRYNRLQDDFQSEDQRKAGLSGIAGGEMGELYQMLSQMQEEKQSFVEEKGKERSDKQKKEQEKKKMGKEVVEMALLRKAQRTSSDDSSEKGGNNEDGTGSSERNVGQNRKNKRRKTQHYDVSRALSVFAERLKEADMARIELETKQLEFEKEKWAVEREAREKDREERKQEREEAQSTELKKFKLMLAVLKNKN